MWYKQLLKFVIEEGREIEDPHVLDPVTVKQNAVNFVFNLLDLVQVEIYHKEELELSLLIGFIVNLYRILLTNHQPLTFERFARRCFCLIILHSKCSEESSVFNSDFIPVFYNKKIFSKLSCDDQIRTLSTNFFNKDNNNSDEDSSDADSPKWEIDDGPRCSIIYKSEFKAIVTLINHWEIEMFKYLRQNVTVRLSSFSRILDYYLITKKDNCEFITSLYNFLQKYKNYDDSFDEYIDEIQAIRLAEYGAPSVAIKLCLQKLLDKSSSNFQTISSKSQIEI